MSCPFLVVGGLPFFLSWLVAESSISGDGKFVQLTGCRSCRLSRLSCKDSVSSAERRFVERGGRTVGLWEQHMYNCICVTTDLGNLLNLQDTLETLACTFGICTLLTALT
jgi:hypothetical protein